MKFRHPPVRKAGGKALDEAESPMRRSEKQAARVRRDPAAIEIGRNSAPKRIAIRATPCVRTAEPSFSAQVVIAKQLSPLRRPDTPVSVRYPS